MSDTSQATPKCPKCDLEMDQGFIVDMGHGGRFVSKWAPGAPVKSWLTTTWVPSNALPIGTFRCRSCGYLESYARPEFGAKGRNQFSLLALFVAITAVAVVTGLVVALLRSSG